MKDEDRLSNLEAALQGLKLVTSGGLNIAAKYPPLPKPEDKPTVHERISALEKAHKEFRIVGGQNVSVAGSMKTGFCINGTCPDTTAGLSGTGFSQVISFPTGACCDEEGGCTVVTQQACINTGGTYQGDETDCDPNPCPEPPEDEGACCVGESCSIETEDDCTGMGGTYQGDDTTCDPDPCVEPPSTGACCVGTDCSIETEDDCGGMGGVYQGDDTTCDPNPCEEPPEDCVCGDVSLFANNAYLPGRRFYQLESYGTVVTTLEGVECTPECDTFLCAFERTCTADGAVMNTVFGDPCDTNSVPGNWDNINSVRSLCDDSECTSASPFPPTSGTYVANNVTACNFHLVPLVFTVEGDSTVHGHLVDETEVECGGTITVTYDLYEVYSNECIPPE